MSSWLPPKDRYCRGHQQFHGHLAISRHSDTSPTQEMPAFNPISVIVSSLGSLCDNHFMLFRSLEKIVDFNITFGDRLGFLLGKGVCGISLPFDLHCILHCLPLRSQWETKVVAAWHCLIAALGDFGLDSKFEDWNGFSTIELEEQCILYSEEKERGARVLVPQSLTRSPWSFTWVSCMKTTP